jgi:hypothetical protein
MEFSLKRGVVVWSRLGYRETAERARDSIALETAAQTSSEVICCSERHCV